MRANFANTDTKGTRLIVRVIEVSKEWRDRLYLRSTEVKFTQLRGTVEWTVVRRPCAYYIGRVWYENLSHDNETSNVHSTSTNVSFVTCPDVTLRGNYFMISKRRPSWFRHYWISRFFQNLLKPPKLGQKVI